jgi:hypothetical protein
MEYNQAIIDEALKPQLDAGNDPVLYILHGIQMHQLALCMHDNLMQQTLAGVTGYDLNEDGIPVFK